MKPTYIDKEPDSAKNLISSIENKEILDFLDQNVANEHRENYLKLKHGLKIPKLQLIKLQQYIQTLLEKTYQCPKNEDN